MTLYKNQYRVKSSRSLDRDYRRNAYYFVTICTHDRRPFFGFIEDGETQL